MLKSISIENFKSYREATLPLAPMTFLIGPNASGKSNALEAIRLLNWLAKGSRLDDIERNIQGGDTVVRGLSRDLFRDAANGLFLGAEIGDIADGWERFKIGIGQQREQLFVMSEEITKANSVVPLYKIDSQPQMHSDEISVAYNNFKRGWVKPHIPCSNRQAVFYQLDTPGRFDKDHAESQKIIPAVVKELRETLRKIVFLDPRPANMRDYVYSKDDVIKEDGCNLSAVLYKICQTGEPQKQELLNFIRSLPEQDITDISFIETERKDVMIRLQESFGQGHRVMDAPLLSDGTLRVLAIAGALLTSASGSLVIIEEVDNGVHPSRARDLIQNILLVANTRNLRVLLTSHNPALLDALPDASLADVICCFRDPLDGDSRLVRLGDMDRFPELVAQGPLGQLVTQKVVDRFLKDRTTQAQRNQANASLFDLLEEDTAP